MRLKKAQNGFSLVELLVVVAVIGILIGLLLPAMQATREAARRMSCSNRVKQLLLALHTYESAHRKLPFGWNTHGTLWSAMILPFMEQGGLYDTLKFAENQNWDLPATSNSRALAQAVSTFRCPSLPVAEHLNYNGVANRVPASYRGNGGNEVTSDDTSTLILPGTKSFEMLGLNGVLYGCSAIRWADISDGTSHTAAIGESHTAPDFIKDGQGMDFWTVGSPQMDPCNCRGGTEGTEFSEASGSFYPRLNAQTLQPATHGQLMELAFGSYHHGGAQFGYCDGSVHFWADTIDLQVYRHMGSRRGDGW